MKSLTHVQSIALGVGLLSCVASPSLAQPASRPGQWTTAWSTSQQGLATTGFSNVTLRLIARVTVPGTQVRLRLANTFGKAPVVIGRAYVGLRVQTATLAPGSNRPVLFKGTASVTLPPGGEVTSDPVAIEVLAHDDLAVSLYVPGAGVLPSQHGGAVVTSYVTNSGVGDVTANEIRFPPGRAVATDSPFTATITSMPWLKAVDVLSPTATGAVVAFGDSITDGSCATVDGYDRWPDWLAIRLNMAGVSKAVLNEGIGGNTVTRENLQPAVNSDPAVDRLERDVLSHAGVTHVILFEGTNDIRREASAAQLMNGVQDVIRRVRARGIKIIGATIIPRHNYPPDGTGNTGWDDGKSKRRREVNEWMRTKAGFDAVLDVDAVMRDPMNPDVNRPTFHCDGIHPSPLGYYAIGQSIPLALFENGTARPASR